jgi:hypothetical protein
MKARSMDKRRLGCVLTAVSALLCSAAIAGEGKPILPSLKTITTRASTVPANGDVNPYGVAQIKHTSGSLRAGHILVSNFNDAGNVQGTGTTIVDVAPDGNVSLFATIDAGTLPGSCPGGIGLTTALVVLEQGWVIVGSLSTANQGSVFSGSGCLVVLDSLGNPVETFYGSLINDPWDMAAFDGEHEAKLFVTNVLNGTVAAGGEIVHGRTLTSGGSPQRSLGLTVTPAGELLTVNGGDGFITEVSPGGAQVAKMLLDSSGSPPGAGGLFGPVFEPAHGVYFVDDATNTLDLLR